jgi:hypothetical protein
MGGLNRIAFLVGCLVPFVSRTRIVFCRSTVNGGHDGNGNAGLLSVPNNPLESEVGPNGGGVAVRSF